MRHSLLIVTFLCSSLFAFAQWSPGFRAGLNLSSFSGPTDMGASVNGEESFSNLTGFHVGGSLRYDIIEDLLSAQVELMYSQKGSQYTYNGEAVQYFSPIGQDLRVEATGPINYSISISNSYLDFPLLVSVKPIQQIEFSAGVNFGLLISSQGTGTKVFSGRTSNGLVLPETNISLDHNYLRDDPREAKGIESDVQTFNNGLEVATVQGAYYDYDQDYGNRYNTFDFGLIGGVNFYFNESLFLGGRINYGLTDITDNTADRSLVEAVNNEPVASDDVDRNLSIQMSIGFSF